MPLTTSLSGMGDLHPILACDRCGHRAGAGGSVALRPPEAGAALRVACGDDCAEHLDDDAPGAEWLPALVFLSRLSATLNL